MRPFTLIVCAILIYAGSRIPSLRAQYAELAAPQLTDQDLLTSTLSLAGQRLALVNYEAQRCQLVQPCLEMSQAGIALEAVAACQRASEGLAQMKLPPQFPIKQGMILELSTTSWKNMMDRLGAAVDPSGEGRRARVLQYLTHFEIDAMGSDSLPQRLFRLYKLEQLSGSPIVACDDFRRLLTKNLE